MGYAGGRDGGGGGGGLAGTMQPKSHPRTGKKGKQTSMKRNEGARLLVISAYCEVTQRQRVKHAASLQAEQAERINCK